MMMMMKMVMMMTLGGLRTDASMEKHFYNTPHSQNHVCTTMVLSELVHILLTEKHCMISLRAILGMCG